LNKIEASYQESIKTLSTIDPIVAYYLSGKTSIVERFEIVEKWFEQLKQACPADVTEIEERTKKVMEILKPNLLSEVNADLEADISSIAWKINPVIWWRTKDTIKQIRHNANIEIDDKLEEVFKKIESALDKPN
jgi:Asp-tRNA(Asn)/Glu-tRNA(Gln) amidotransferase C subunit